MSGADPCSCCVYFVSVVEIVRREAITVFVGLNRQAATVATAGWDSETSAAHVPECVCVK